MTSPASRPSHLSALSALALDVVLVVGFAAAGRASHDSDVLAGLVQTSWPFLAGLALGWLVTRAWRAPLAPVRTGLGVWGATLVVGMLLRVLSGQGVALAFVIVAALVLCAVLVGWRAIAVGITLLVARRAEADSRRTDRQEASA